jgi:hypothetical protein
VGRRPARRRVRVLGLRPAGATAWDRLAPKADGIRGRSIHSGRCGELPSQSRPKFGNWFHVPAFSARTCSHRDNSDLR